MEEKTYWFIGGYLKVSKSSIKLNPLKTTVFSEKLKGG